LRTAGRFTPRLWTTTTAIRTGLQASEAPGTAADAIGRITLYATEILMSPYIDAIVIPVPRANLDTYKRMSAEWGNAHLRHGALYYSDSISDDVQPGKVTSFPQAVQLKDGEVIALAWVVYRNKEDRDRIGKAVMEDPQLKESMDPSKMPFDGKRMFWGGFQTIVGLGGGK
jgi:uncharacterized protein YbaA (DUF1428 family)